MPETGLRGRWLWMQLVTTDPDSAIRFYCAVLGWETETYHGAGEPYLMFTAHGAPIAGVMAKPADSKGPPAWLGYAGTPDVDAAVARVVELGGGVRLQATDLPTVGRFAVVADPCGAPFGLYRPLSGMAPPVEPPAEGEFSWHELTTDEIENALAFYGDLFGWAPGPRHDMGPLGVYQVYERKGRPRGGIFRRPPEAPRCAWLRYVRATSVAQTAASVSAQGGVVLQEPVEVPGGDRVAICADPQGAHFALHEVKAT